jgi:archaellum component FlaF (FlaF/FlaG flagellin family)
MVNHVDSHLNTIISSIINALTKTFKISIIKNGVVLMMIAQVLLNGEIVQVRDWNKYK